MFFWYCSLHHPKIMKTLLSILSCLLVKNTNKGKDQLGNQIVLITIIAIKISSRTVSIHDEPGKKSSKWVK